MRRWFLFLFSFVTVSLAAGLVYGWPALRRNLREEGKSNLSEQTLGGIFTAGAWSTHGGRFLFGLARDRYGTKVTAVLALSCLTGGSLGIALSDPNGAAQLGVSLFLVGLGSGAQICVQPVAGLFSRPGTVLATLSGAFQIAGLVFLVLTQIFNDRRIAFGGFTVVVAGLTVLAAMILPKGSSFGPDHCNNDCNGSSPMEEADECDTHIEADTLGEDQIMSNDEEGDLVVNNGTPEGRSESLHETTSESDIVAPPTAYQQIKSLEYILLVFWFSACITPLQYYVGSIGFQLEDKGDDDGFYTGLYSILYASAAVLAPLGGHICDSAGLGVTQGLATLLCAFSLFLLASDVGLDGQVAGLASYGIGRMMVLATFFSNMGKRFGYGKYGTLAGLGLLLSALVTLLQYPLIALAANGNAREVNIGCGIVLVSVIPYCAWLGIRERRGKSALATRSPLPAAA